MRFLAVIVTAAAIIVSVFFGLSTAGVRSQIAENEQNIQTALNAMQVYDDRYAEAEQQLQQAQARLDELTAEYEHQQILDNYRDTPTAFITFDDAPNEYTDSLLQILDDYSVKATFFVIGTRLQTQTQRNYLKRIYESGHEIGIHSYSHDMSLIYSSEDAFFEDLYKTSELIEQICGVKPKLVRLPGGTASAKTLCERYSGSAETFGNIMQRLSDEGYTVTDWNVDSGDWDTSLTSEEIVDNVRNGASGRLGAEYKTALVLLHGQRYSRDALSQVIQTLSGLGYDFDKMSANGYTYVQTLR